jgi:hypothetical protein
MPNLGTAANAIVSGGIGASFGAIITAIIQTVSGKKVARAQAADIIEATAGRWLERLNERNQQLEDENNAYRQALNLVEDACEELITAIYHTYTENKTEPWDGPPLYPDLVQIVRQRLAKAREISLNRKPTEAMDLGGTNQRSRNKRKGST